MVIVKFLNDFGKYLIMLGTGLQRPENSNMYYKETLRQMNDIGVGSVSIVFHLFISVFVKFFSYQVNQHRHQKDVDRT